MKEKPYIGVTGIKNLNEVFFLDKYFEATIDCKKSSYIPMLGFLSSEKRLRFPEDPGKRAPAANELNSLLEASSSNSLKMIHYYTKNTDRLADQVSALFEDKYEDLCRSLQLNVKFPPIKEIEKIIRRFPAIKIVYQLSKDMLDIGIKEITEESSAYDTLVSYALIDPSGGYGLEFDSGYYADVLSALKEKMPTTRLGIAGGFDASNVKEKVSSVKFDGAFSIDAESKLRYEDNKGLDPEKLLSYLKNASCALLSKDL